MHSRSFPEAALKPTQTTPLFPELGVIGLVPETWGGPWMVRHHILTRLSRYFNVIWVDPAQEWRDWWLPGRSLSTPSLNPDVPDLPGFRLYRANRWYPRVYNPPRFGQALENARLRRAAAHLRGMGARSIALYLWRPEFAAAMDAGVHDFSCYHIDDEYSFSSSEQPVSVEEARLIKRVDQVIVHSPALMEKKGGLNPRTALIPNGTDYQAFSEPTREPADLAAVPHPRIGYVGMVKEQLDLHLIAELAARHSSWSFVFVGPNRVPREDPNATRLESMANVHFLGGREVSSLPAYMQHMDVCTMPYVLDDYTKFIYPMKMHEYLATGRRVVSRPIRSVQPFGDVIRLATTVDEWSAALKEAADPTTDSVEQKTQRQVVAEAHDWSNIAFRVAQQFSRALDLH